MTAEMLLMSLPLCLPKPLQSKGEQFLVCPSAPVLRVSRNGVQSGRGHDGGCVRDGELEQERQAST